MQGQSEEVMQMMAEAGYTPARPSGMRRSVAAVAAAGSALLVVGGCLSLSMIKGHNAGELAQFRRWDKEQGGVVELVGQYAAIDGFNCFLDTSQGIFRLMASLLTFKDLGVTCASVATVTGQARCAAAFNSALLNFILIASMVGQAVSDCQGSLVWPAACTAGVSGFMASLEVFPMSVAGIKLTCSQWWRHQRVPPYGVTTTRATTTRAPLFTTRTRFVFTTPAATPPNLPFPTLVPSAYWWKNTQKANYGTNIAKCVPYVGQALMFLGRAAILLMDTAKWCTPDKQVIKAGQQHCATDILTVFATASVTAQFLAAAVPACAGVYASTDNDVMGAACATYCIGISTSVFASTPVAMKLPALCPKMLWTSTLPPIPTPVPKPHWLPNGQPRPVDDA